MIYQVREEELKRFKQFTLNESIFNLFEKIGEAIFLVDDENNLIYMNQKASAVTELAKDEAVDQSIEDIIELYNDNRRLSIVTIFDIVKEHRTNVGLPKYTQLVTNKGAKKICISQY